MKGLSIMRDLAKLIACLAVGLLSHSIFATNNKTCPKFRGLYDRYQTTPMIPSQFSGHPLERMIGKSIEDISEINIDKDSKALGRLSAEESIVLNKLKKLRPGMYIRMKPERLALALVYGGIGSSTAMESRVNSAPRWTPNIEHQLFGALEYVFTSLGFWKGNPAYGSVVFKIDDDFWKSNRFFGSHHSGWYNIKHAAKIAGVETHAEIPPEVVEAARPYFSRMCYSHHQALEAMAIYAFEGIRRYGGKDLMEKFANAHISDYQKLLLENQLFYMEGHIWNVVPFDAIKSVEMPNEVAEVFKEDFEQIGVQVTISETP